MVALALAVAVLGSAVVLEAADLTDAAARAFTERADQAQQAFLARAAGPISTEPQLVKTLTGGAIAAEAGSGDGINEVTDGLLHHWRARVLLPGVTLDQVLPISQSYPDYPHVFHPVVSAKILEHNGDRYKVQFRMRESAGGLSATLDVRAGITYGRPDARSAYVISRSEEIREVKDAGRPSERQLPAGQDNGYLWRSATFTRFVEDPSGVWMEMETLGLSRQFPPVLGWVIEPIARRVGRRSAEASVDEFRRAVAARAGKTTAIE